MRISDWSSDVCSSDVDDGVVNIAAVGENRIERGDRAAGFAVDAGAFAQRGNEREDRRRIALHRRRFAQCRSAEHTSDLQSLMRISYAVFCLKTKLPYTHSTSTTHHLRSVTSY